jgi:GT2 family glycosyltransferase
MPTSAPDRRQPLVSVIIVNHNGILFIERCLKSVLSTEYSNFEVILVDNDSTDGSREYVLETFGSDPRVHIVCNAASFGPAKGRNIGAQQASGEYLVFLDNDTVVSQNWLTAMVEMFQAYPFVGSAQSKLLSLAAPERFDYAGDYLTQFGFLSERAGGAVDRAQLDYVAVIFSAKSAASGVRRSIFDHIGGFDEDFYMYVEETDLSWRVWLAGYLVVFVPNSVVYHAYGSPEKKQYLASDSSLRYLIKYWGCRNYIGTIFKNLELQNLLWMLPLHVSCWLGIAAWLLVRRTPRDAYWILKGILWNVAHFPVLWKKRWYVQRRVRVTSDRVILRRVMQYKSLGYFYRKLSGPQGTWGDI